MPIKENNSNKPRGATSFYDFQQDGQQTPPAGSQPGGSSGAASVSGSGAAAPPAGGQPSGQGPAGSVGNGASSGSPQSGAPQSGSPQSGSQSGSQQSGSQSGSQQSGSQSGSQQPYLQFSGNNYADVESFIRRQMADYTPETEEERKKRERRERRAKSLAAIADVLGAMHKAYSYQRGVKPMDLPNMSEKAQARFDKAQAERDKDRDRYLNYAITLGNLKDKDRDFNFRIEQARNQQNNWQATNDAKREDRAEDVAWRKERADVEDDRWSKSFDLDKREADDKHNVAQATVRQKDASATNSYAQAGKASSGGSSGGGKKPYGTFLGKTYQSKADYDKAVAAYAEENGVATTEMVGGYGSAHVGGTQRNRPISTVAAEAEKHYRRTHAQQQNTQQQEPQPKPKAQPKPQAKTQSNPNDENWASGLKLKQSRQQH